MVTAARSADPEYPSGAANIHLIKLTTTSWRTPERVVVPENHIRTDSGQPVSVRKINMTISLAFLAPDLVKAAVDGRLPHGMGVARLTDLPAEWSRQHLMLGLLAE
jgi:hypothetical protein